jgi:hypothetical protein
MYGRDDDPYLILSKQMLITAYSDTKVISEFLAAQLHISMNDFEFDSLDKFHYLIFKYKKIVIEI